MNKSVAEGTKIPMIGCPSHRLQLVLETFLKSFNRFLLKIHSSMTKLRNLKLSAKLRGFTHLRPAIRNSVHFKCGVVKIIDNKESDLSVVETLTCGRLRKRTDDKSVTKRKTTDPCSLSVKTSQQTFFKIDSTAPLTLNI